MELKARVDNLTLSNAHYHGLKLETLTYDELRAISVTLKATALKVEAELIYVLFSSLHILFFRNKKSRLDVAFV